MGFGKRSDVVAFAMMLVVAGCGSQAKRSDASADVHDTTASPPSVAPAHAGRKQIVFVGTSLTAGLGLPADSAYPALIQEKIDSAGLPFEVTNAGVSGETSAGLVERLDWLMRGPFDVIVVETGANDGLRALPVSSLAANLDTVLTRIHATHPDAHVIVAQMEAPPNLGREYTAAFHAVFANAARAHGATLMPFLLKGVAGDARLNQADGLHPTLVGERIVAANVWRTVLPVLEAETAGLSGAVKTR